MRVSPDLLKTRQRGDVVLFACLAAQQPAVVDNTNARRAQRVRYVKLAHAAQFKAVLYVFEVPVAEAVGRNEARERQVPNVAIFSTAKKFDPPGPEEAFDAVFTVRPDGAGGFAIDEWVDEA